MGRIRKTLKLAISPVLVNQLDCNTDIVPTYHVNILFLKLLIDLEEVNDLFEGVLVDIVDRFPVVVARILRRHAENFLVRALVVPHFQDSDGFCLNDAPWKSWVQQQDEHVDRIAVEVVSLRNISVIKRIEEWRIENSVQLYKPGFLINLIFICAPLWDLDDGVENKGRFRPNRHIQ